VVRGTGAADYGNCLMARRVLLDWKRGLSRKFLITGTFLNLCQNKMIPDTRNIMFLLTGTYAICSFIQELVPDSRNIKSWEMVTQI
jgi:hypothetical protein